MRRLAFLTAFSMMALFVFAPAAFAQYPDTLQEEFEEEVGEEIITEGVPEPLPEEIAEAKTETVLEQQTGEESVEVEDQKVIPQGGQQKQMPKAEKAKAEKAKAEKAKEMPKTGGMSVGSALLPAAGLLLLGSGVLVFAAVRRR